MHSIYLVSPPARAAHLAEELARRGIANEPAAENARPLVISSLAKTDAAAAAAVLSSLGADAIAAAEMPPHFPFAAALLKRAEKMWNRAPLVIPPLRIRENAVRAADIIAAAISAKSVAENGAPSAQGITPEKAVAAARRALDDILQ